MPTPCSQTATIRIDARGRWLHDGDPIAAAVAEQFARHVVAKEDGHYELAWHQQRQAIDVEDTPFFVRNMQVHKSGGQIRSVEIEVSDGATETLDPTTLMQAGEHILYCCIERNGVVVPCRFTSSLYHLLAQHVEPAGSSYALPLDGHAYPLRPYQARPHRQN